jgi:hypothetical protein
MLAAIVCFCETSGSSQQRLRPHAHLLGADNAVPMQRQLENGDRTERVGKEQGVRIYAIPVGTRRGKREHPQAVLGVTAQM